MAAIANVVVGVAALPLPLPSITNAFSYSHNKNQRLRLDLSCSKTNQRTSLCRSSLLSPLTKTANCFVLACLPPTPPSASESSRSSSNTRPSFAASSTKLYVSGLSFRTTEESLRNAFKNFGQLVEVNLVMDKIANRPRGFAFLRYATEDESQKAIEGMHGKFLDGRVIFVEVAKPRSELRQQRLNQNSRY